MSEKAVIIAAQRGLLKGLSLKNFSNVKDVLDLIMALVLFVIFLPLMAFCAMVIKHSDPGPMFYCQRRLGKDGEEFWVYKLRTMFVDAEAGTGEIWAADHDPRIIPSCRWMRRSHVDELPQLINVIKGQMSLVGPRPERKDIHEKLREHYPDIDRRLTVRPGITGLAQIRCGYDTSVQKFADKLKNDMEYIDKQSLWEDIKIVFKTFPKFCDDHQAH